MSRATYVLEIWFLEFSLESLIPAFVHGALLEVADTIDNFISGRRNGFFFNNSLISRCYFLAIRASRGSVAANK